MSRSVFVPVLLHRNVILFEFYCQFSSASINIVVSFALPISPLLNISLHEKDLLNYLLCAWQCCAKQQTHYSNHSCKLHFDKFSSKYAYFIIIDEHWTQHSSNVIFVGTRFRCIDARKLVIWMHVQFPCMVIDVNHQPNQFHTKISTKLAHIRKMWHKVFYFEWHTAGFYSTDLSAFPSLFRYFHALLSYCLVMYAAPFSAFSSHHSMLVVRQTCPLKI